MSRVFKVLPFALAVIAFGILAASCGNGNAHYRVVNTVANTTSFNSGGFDITINGSVVWPGVPFPATEPTSTGKYQSASGGTDTLGVYQAGQGGQTGATPLFTSALNLSGGTDYTVVLGGNSTASGATYPLATQVISDLNPTPTAGDAGVRIIDASPYLTGLDPTGVDVFVLPPPPEGECCTEGTGQVASALLYPQSGGSGNINSGYTNVGIPTSGSVWVWVTGHNNTLFEIYHNAYTLNVGQNYTLVLADAIGGGYPPQFIFLTP